MKKILLSLILAGITVSLCFAQQGRPQRGQGQQGGGARNMGASIGLIKYDAEQALKKMKIEDEQVASEVTGFIEAYNVKIDSLRADTRPVFEEMRKQMRSIRQSGDFNQMRSLREQSRQKFAPVREQTKAWEAELDTQLQPLLDKKQLKKWTNYKASKRPTPQGGGGFRQN